MIYSSLLSVTMYHQDLEILMSRWSVESHTFITAWVEFRPTLEGVMNLTMLPLYEETNSVCVVLGDEDEPKLQSLASIGPRLKCLASLRTRPR